jgi:hypothetical protein
MVGRTGDRGARPVPHRDLPGLQALVSSSQGAPNARSRPARRSRVRPPPAGPHLAFELAEQSSPRRRVRGRHGARGRSGRTHVRSAARWRKRLDRGVRTRCLDRRRPDSDTATRDRDRTARRGLKPVSPGCASRAAPAIATSACASMQQQQRGSVPSPDSARTRLLMQVPRSPAGVREVASGNLAEFRGYPARPISRSATARSPCREAAGGVSGRRGGAAFRRRRQRARRPPGRRAPERHRHDG